MSFHVNHLLTIHVKHNILKMSSAAVVISALKVKAFMLFGF